MIGWGAPARGRDACGEDRDVVRRRERRELRALGGGLARAVGAREAWVERAFVLNLYFYKLIEK